MLSENLKKLKKPVREFFLPLAALYSNAALNEVHEKRRLLRPSLENRNWLTLFCAISLAGLLIGFLYSQAWSRQNAGTYLAERPNVVYLSPDETRWRISEFQARDCVSGWSCYDQLYGKTGPTQKIDIEKDNLFVPSDLQQKNETNLVLFEFILSPNPWKRLADFPSLVLSLPKFEFRRADLFISGMHRGTFFAGGRIKVEFEPGSTGFNPEQIDVLLEVPNSQKYITAKSYPGLNRIEKNVSVMTLAEDREYVEFITADRAARGNFIGVIARIVMAMFVLSLFLIIDGSPETLGLGISLGFEAFATTLNFGWLPITHPEWLIEIALQMSDVFRLYFFLQLARMVDKSIGKWIILGLLTSFPILFMQFNYLQNGGLTGFGNMRDLLVGTLGIIICLRAAWFLKGKDVPWRVMALVVGAIAGGEQIFQPIISLFPDLAQVEWLQSLASVMLPSSSWFLALSAFINISTLENRVQTLSKAQVEARELAREMELGKAVQDTFYRPPVLPENLQLSYFHEAMFYVSGDTFFANWNERQERLSAVVCDITGHGVQAALKASGVHSLATSVWREPSQDTLLGRQIQDYALLLESFFKRISEKSDFASFVGFEIDLKTQKICIQGQNFPNPIYLEKLEKGGWSARALSLGRGEPFQFDFTEGSLLVLASDGFIDGSRRERALVRFINQRLSPETSTLTASQIESIIKEFSSEQSSLAKDDRSLVILQKDEGLRKKMVA